MKTELKNTAGKNLKSIQLESTVFDADVNEAVVHQVVKAQLAGARSGSADTKQRAEVRGGGKKPWRQKGTGRARAGSIRSPLWKGGGTTFGPTPRDYSQKVPRKIGKLALRSILSDKAKSGDLVIVDKIGFDRPATKKAQKLLNDLEITGKLTAVVEDSDEMAIKSLRNIPKVCVIPASKINAYDLVDCSSLLMTKEALDKVTEVLAIAKR